MGNILLRDEGFGVFVAEELAKMPLPEGVTAVDGSMVGRDFAPLLQENDKVILVNVQKRDLPPATLFKSDLNQVKESISKKVTSLDQLAFFAALDDLTFAGIPPQVVVISLMPKVIDVGMGLSDEVKACVPKAIEMIWQEIEAVR
ncbi:MAG: hydrogenase maturation protease [Actinomycetota bacterium]|nr:hydrogenase maturation protease [Actinomycetota bacterium]